MGFLIVLRQDAFRRKADAIRKKRLEDEAIRREEAQENRQKAEENRQKAEEESRKDEEERWKNRLENLISNSTWLFGRLPALLSHAEAHIDRAHGDFGDSAFAPFWDEVENATTKLAQYCEDVKTIQGIAREYQKDVANVPFLVRPFPLTVSQLSDPVPSVTRLKELVRGAQKDFQFATIYEQRKTNQILREGNQVLREGFGTLASVIYNLSDLMGSSLRGLAGTLNAVRCVEERSLEKHEEQTKILDDMRWRQWRQNP